MTRRFLKYKLKNKQPVLSFIGCSFVSIITVNELIIENDRINKLYFHKKE